MTEEADNYILKLSFLALILVVGVLLVSNSLARKKSEGWGAMQYPQLVLGMIAIFTYVGVEVTIQGNLPELLKTKAFGSLNETEIAPYISMYWGGLMIGRWTGSIGAFDISKSFIGLFVQAILMLFSSFSIEKSSLVQSLLTTVIEVICIFSYVVNLSLHEIHSLLLLTEFEDSLDSITLVLLLLHVGQFINSSYTKCSV